MDADLSHDPDDISRMIDASESADLIIGSRYIEGVNVIKRHLRARPNVRQAGIVQQEAPFHISNVMLVCSHCSRAVRVGHKFLDDNKKVRVCVSCREVID
mgnify:CR=1 FL=1